MLTSKECFKKYGDPTKESNMILWTVPDSLKIDRIPKKIYCNKDIVEELEKSFSNIITRDLEKQILTWDGCFNIRNKKSSKSTSLHAWGVAIDINAAWNGYGKKPTMSKELYQCFLDAGFDWGGFWSKPDGMHFQCKSK